MAKAQTADMGPPLIRLWLFPNAPIKGRNRKHLYALTGHLQVPYLIDRNREVGMFESADIVRYLESTYGEPTP
jgi:glutathione S-transferase